MTKQQVLSSSTQNFVLQIDDSDIEDKKQSKFCCNDKRKNICTIFITCFIISLLLIIIFNVVLIIIDVCTLCRSNKENCNTAIANEGSWLFFVFLVLIFISIIICTN